MQSVLRSAARRAVAAGCRRGLATNANTNITKAAPITEAEKEWAAEKAWVTALVQREVRAQVLAAEEDRRARELLRTTLEEWRAANRLKALADEAWRMRFLTAYGVFLGGWMSFWFLVILR